MSAIGSDMPKRTVGSGRNRKASVGKKGGGGAFSSEGSKASANKFSSKVGGFRGAVAERDGKTSGQKSETHSDLYAIKSDSSSKESGKTAVGGSKGPTAAERAQASIDAAAARNQDPTKSSVVKGLNLDTLGAVVTKPVDAPGYEKTDYGYIQTDPKQPGADYLLLVKDPTKMTDQQKHYMRNVEMADLIHDGKIPTDLKTFKCRELKNYKILPEIKSAYHMNGKDGGYNVKLVNSRDSHGYKSGELEVVYSTVTGKLDLRPENMPTINRAGPDEFWEHKSKDVDPYGDYGNTPHDKTSGLKKKTGNLIPNQSDRAKRAKYQRTREDLGEVTTPVTRKGVKVF